MECKKIQYRPKKRRDNTDEKVKGRLVILYVHMFQIESEDVMLVMLFTPATQ